MRGRQFNDEASKLLQSCNAARRSGADFPRIWHEILKNSSLVAGSPTQRIDENGPVLEVRLITGQRIVSGMRGFSIL